MFFLYFQLLCIRRTCLTGRNSRMPFWWPISSLTNLSSKMFNSQQRTMINTLCLKIFYIRSNLQSTCYVTVFILAFEERELNMCINSCFFVSVSDHALLFAWYRNQSVDTVGFFECSKVKAIWRSTVRSCSVPWHLHVWYITFWFSSFFLAFLTLAYLILS